MSAGKTNIKDIPQKISLKKKKMKSLEKKFDEDSKSSKKYQSRPL